MQTARQNALPRYALRLYAGVVVVVLALASGAAFGDKKQEPKLYKWVDENGIVHYGDHVPAEYSKSERQVLNEQGVPIKTLQKELTPAEMAAELRRIELESERAQAAERASQRDHILLLSYINVQEIEMLRDQRIGTLDGELRVNEHYVGSLRSRLLELEGKASTYNYPFDPDSELPQLPDDLAEDLLHTVDQLGRREEESQRIRQEQAQIKAQFDADIARFKELKPEASSDAAAATAP
jgi:hypothetical protein